MDKKGIAIIGIVVVIFAGLIIYVNLASKDDNPTQADQGETNDRIRVIEDDDATTPPAEETPIVDAPDEVEVEEPEAETDEPADSSEPATTESITYTGAKSTENAQVLGYSYAVAAGRLEFTFIVSSAAANKYPSYEAGYNDDGVVTFMFTDMTRDSIYSSLNESDLGQKLPVVTTSQAGTKTTYVFTPKVESKKTFDVVRGQNSEGKFTITLKADL